MNKARLETRLDSIPAPIALALRKLLSRSRKVILFRGISAVATVFIGTTLLVMGVDASIMIASPIMRWILSAIIYSSTAITSYFFLVKPLARSYTLAGVAQMIESHHPELQERLSSAVELLTTSDEPGVRGSQKLIDVLAEAAADDARKISPKNEISMKVAVPYFLTLFILLLILAAIFAMSPRKASFLLARATAPFANLPNISALDLEVKPGDVFVPRGNHLEISVIAAKGGVKSARLYRLTDDGSEMTDEMRRKMDDVKEKAQCFIFDISSVERDFIYRIQADDAITRYYKATVVTPPAIESMDLKIDYPEYSGLPQSMEKNSSGTITALAGSVATISLKINKPSSDAVLKIDLSTPISIKGEAVSENNGENRIVFHLPLSSGLTGIYSIRITDEHGLTNPKFEHAVQALPDLPPVALITDLPQKEIRLKADDQFPFYFFATDDIGLKSVELLFEKDSAKLAPRLLPINPSSSEKELLRKFKGDAMIDLKDPELRGVKKLTFQIVVTDNLPENFKGPQKGYSEIYTILIDDNAKIFKEQALHSQEEALKNQLLQAKKELEESKQKLPGVKEIAAKNEKKPEQLSERVGALRENLASADATLRELDEKLNDGFFNDIADKIKEIHEEQLVKAQSLTEQVALAEKADERTKLADDVGIQLEKTITAVNELLKKSETAAKAMQRAIEMESLAGRQENLAKQKLLIDSHQPATDKIAAPDPELKKQMDEWKKEQDKVADALAKIARELAPQGIDDLKKAGKIAEEARQLNAEQGQLAENAQKIPELQKLDKRIGELAEQQVAAAELAKSNMLTKPATSAMQDAAEKISQEKLEDAIRQQNEAVSTINEANEQIKKETASDPWKRSESPQETLKELSDKAKKSSEAAATEVGKAKAAEKAVKDEAGKFEQKAKTAGKSVDKDKAAEIEEKKAIMKELEQKAKEAVAKTEQMSRESQNLAKETSDIAKRLAPNTPPPEAANIVSQAEQKARDSEQKAMMASQAEKAAEFAAKMASDLNNKELGDKNYQAEPVRQAEALAKKALESAKSAEEAVSKAGKAVEATDKSIEALKKAQSDAAQKAQPELAKEIGERIYTAQREESMAKQALNDARQAAAMSKQSAEQGKNGAEAASKNQNRRNAASQAQEAMRKSLEAAQQADLANNILKESATADRSARQEVVDELVKMQKSLKDKTEELMKEKKKALDEHMRAQTAELEKRQDAVAKEAKAIAALVAEETPDNSKIAEQAGDAAEKTKNSLHDSKLDSAAKTATETAKALNELSKKLEAEAAVKIGDEKQSDPKKDSSESGSENLPEERGENAKLIPDSKLPFSQVSQLAKRADEAARTQEFIQNEIEALSKGKPIEHLAAKQETIKEQTEDLKKEAESFQIQARELNFPQMSQQLAAEGERSLQTAFQNAGNAEKTISKMGEESKQIKENPKKNLSGNLPNEMKQSQTASSQSLDQAAAKMSEAQKVIDEALKKIPVKEQQKDSDLPLAYGLAREAAVEQNSIDAIQAAESLAAVAREAVDEAAKTGVNVVPSKISTVGTGVRNSNPTASQAPPAFEAISKRLGIKYEDWLRLPGSLRSDIIQSSLSEGPEEYREIIKRYFEELSKRGMEGK